MPTNFPGGVSSFGFPLVGSGPYVTTGGVFFVHSGTGINAPGGRQGRGSSPSTPWASIAYAITQATSAKGDIIFVLPGHTESITAAAGWAITSKNGLSIIGIGNPGNRPVITFSTSTAAQITCSSSGVRWVNLEFDLTGIDAVAAGFAVSGADFTAENCRFVIASATAQATKAFVLSGARPRFYGCDFYGTTDAGPASALETAAAVVGLEVVKCRIRGNFSVAPIVAGSTNHATDLLIEHCSLRQANGTAKAVISVTTTSTGDIRYNTFRGTTWGSVADAIVGSNAALKFFQNFGIDDTAAADSGLLTPAAGTVS